MPVDTQHPLYISHDARARRVRDAVEGSDAVKKRGDFYLPMPNPEEPDAEKRFESYKKRALWLGVTGRTHDGMLGAIFRKDPTIDLPTELEYLIEDADGSQMSLRQFCRGVCSYLMRNGRHGVLVDYPEAPDETTHENVAGLNAYLRTYDSPAIWNWRRSGEKLSLVVLKELYEDPVDEFQFDIEEQYRVLSLDEDGFYVQRVFRDNQEVSRIEPRMANGERFDFIPFQFFGAMNNDEYPDKPLLLDLADVNYDHYRSSANRREASFIVGQPMLHLDIGETTTEDWKVLNPNGVLFGSRQGIQTQGGSATLLQAQPNDMSRQDMVDAEEQMVRIGARLIRNGSGGETAESVKERSGADTANLSTVAHNVSDGVRHCLVWAGMFMSSRDLTPSIVFELNQQFYDKTADPQDVMARIQELDRGLIAVSDYRDWRRETGGIDPERTDEDIDAEVGSGGSVVL